MKEPFLSAKPVLKLLQENNYQAFFVGGSIRDLILGREIDDIDIATSATPNEVMKLFPQHVPIGVEHGTVLIITPLGQYEVTTFRHDGSYQDHRHPSNVTFVSSIDEDLSRRDFTMNAIAMDVHGEIYDPYDGMASIKQRIIRTVGNATQRFQEDALRMMRAVRFMSQLGFTLDTSIEQAIMENNRLLGSIAVERIRIEFEKMLKGKFPEQALIKIQELEIEKRLPGFDASVDFSKVIHPNLTKLNKLREFWSFFMMRLDIHDAAAILRLWKNPTSLIADVERMTKALYYLSGSSWTKQLVYQLGKELTDSVAKVDSLLHDKDMEQERRDAKLLFDSLPIKTKADIQANGRDIMDWLNKKPGPWLGKILVELESLIIEGKLKNNRVHIKEWVEKCSQK